MSTETTANTSLDIGTRFDTLEKLKITCVDVAVRDGFEFRVLRSNPNRYEIKCKVETCPWRIYARSVKKTPVFRIQRVTNEHNCVGPTHLGHCNVTQKFLANKLAEKIATQPNYRPVDIVKDIHLQYGVAVKYHKAFRAKDDAFVKINGTHEEAYKYLPKYCEDLQEANVGSLIELETTPDNKFRRVFVSYGASGQGFSHCRPLLGLDGTHLTSKYKGITYRPQFVLKSRHLARSDRY
jgi:hypothetical protein